MTTEYNETIACLKNTPKLFAQYEKLSGFWKKQFLEFMEGKKSLPLTYDPFFKKIFHPDIHKERLESLISSLLGMNVHVVALLPNEDSMMAGESLLIMDLLVELEDGSLCNVEIQKQPYGFPAQRISCYSADLLMRQYTRVKGEKGQAFGYKDIKKVYVIVIYEHSTQIFHEHPDDYIHYGKVTFQTELNLELLQEFCLIALDVFSRKPYPKDKNIQYAWLSLLTTDSLEHAETLIQEYPWTEEIYREIAMLRHQPEEVLEMYSEALKKLDENTLKYFVEQQSEKISEQFDQLMLQEEKISQQFDQLMLQEEKISQQSEKLVLQESQISQQNEKLVLQESQISQQSEKLVLQESQISQQKARIAELERLLAAK